MSMSDSSDVSIFDDDDDEMLHKVIMGEANIEDNMVVPTQTPSTTINSYLKEKLVPIQPDDDMKAKLFQAEGEIAILRSQLQLIRQQKQLEMMNLTKTYQNFKREADEKVNSLKTSLENLEDEKKFLDNELRSNASLKKRKLVKNGFDNQVETIINKKVVDQPIIGQKIIKVVDESSIFMDHLWSYCINGSDRSCLDYLSKICLDFELHVQDMIIFPKKPISLILMDYFIMKKHLRLDELIENFVLTVTDLCLILINRKVLTSIPYLFSMVFCCLCFRPAAIKQNLITDLLKKFTKVISDYSFLLDSNLNEDDFINYHDVPNQVMIIEKFIFIVINDILERLVLLSTQYDPQFINSIWQDSVLSINLFKKMLPENSERLSNCGQINLIYNYVEILICSITNESFAYNNHPDYSNLEIFNSLFKVFLIEIPLKEDFMFFGLNRILGNNLDFKKIDSIVPVVQDFLGNNLITYPQPIPFDLLKQNLNNQDLKYELLWNHEFHLLNLRIRIASLIESFIINTQQVEILQNKEFYKSIIRIIGFQQNAITKSPRSQYIDKRIQIISKLTKVLYYITQDVNDISQLIFPETMYEFFVVISRIAFGSDSLSTEAHQFLLNIRLKGYMDPVFNESCELKAREVNHITMNDNDYKLIADIESDFANGLEFPYESDTIELAREILNQIVTHEEADNIYFSMNYEEFNGFDEMELVQ